MAEIVSLQKWREEQVMDEVLRTAQLADFWCFDEILYADDMHAAAVTLITELNGLPQPLRIFCLQRSKLLPPGYLVGMRGAEAVILAGPEKEHV